MNNIELYEIVIGLFEKYGVSNKKLIDEIVLEVRRAGYIRPHQIEFDKSFNEEFEKWWKEMVKSGKIRIPLRKYL